VGYVSRVDLEVYGMKLKNEYCRVVRLKSASSNTCEVKESFRYGGVALVAIVPRLFG